LSKFGLANVAIPLFVDDVILSIANDVMSPEQQQRLSFYIVLVTTFIGFCAFYAPQPLLPTFTQAFSVGSTASAWLITLPFICLAVAPVFIGGLLQTASAQRVLFFACLILSLTLFGFALSSTFSYLLFFRAIQAAMLPVIFTAAITYCSRAGDAAGRQARIALYISITILGGFSGRLLGGFLGEQLGWQAPFLLFGLLALCCAPAVWLQVHDIALHGKPLKAKSVFALFRQQDMRAGLSFVFATFFTFAGSLNVIPFRLVELEPNISSFNISLVYAGYSVGIFIPMLARWFSERSGSELATLKVGFGLLLLGLLGMSIPSIGVLYVVFLVLSMGMFTIHATASGLLNNLHPDRASLVNGAYISNYYAAAAIGSILPVWLVQQFNWSVYVVLQLCIALSGIWHLAKLTSAVDTSRNA